MIFPPGTDVWFRPRRPADWYKQRVGTVLVAPRGGRRWYVLRDITDDREMLTVIPAVQVLGEVEWE